MSAHLKHAHQAQIVLKLLGNSKVDRIIKDFITDIVSDEISVQEAKPLTDEALGQAKKGEATGLDFLNNLEQQAEVNEALQEVQYE